MVVDGSPGPPVRVIMTLPLASIVASTGICTSMAPPAATVTRWGSAMSDDSPAPSAPALTLNSSSPGLRGLEFSDFQHPLSLPYGECQAGDLLTFSNIKFQLRGIGDVKFCQPLSAD